jgi:hypothetical protein
MADIPDTITVFQIEYSFRDHAKKRMTRREVTADEVRQTLEDGTCREQSHGTDICEHEFWIEDEQVWKEVQVVVDRDDKAIVTIMATKRK